MAVHGTGVPESGIDVGDMIFLSLAAAAVTGAVVGSFLAAILLRWPRGESVAAGRSRCDRCGARIRALDLVPLLSFLYLRGGCRSCGAEIDRAHPAIELAGVVIGLTAVLADPEHWPVTAIFGWWLLLIVSLDLRHQWLPDLLTLPLVPAGLLVAALGVGPALEDRLLGTLIGFGALLAIALAYRAVRGREGMGGGDPKLMAGLGAWLGWQSLPYVILGAGVAGLAAALVMRARRQSVGAETRLPLGSFLGVAAWPCWLILAS